MSFGWPALLWLLAVLPLLALAHGLALRRRRRETRMQPAMVRPAATPGLGGATRRWLPPVLLLLALPPALLLAWASWRFVEQPARRWVRQRLG